MTTLNDAKLSATDRASRVVFGFALIGIAYFGSGPLGLIALLPLIAILPLMTATLGHCPVEGSIRSAWRSSHPVATYHRAATVGVRHRDDSSRR